MSVEPWIDAWPRSAMIPPPGRPMLPEQQLEDRRGRGCTARRPCAASSRPRRRTPTCARGPELSHSASATWRNCSRGMPHDSLDHLRRVAREVALEDLEDAARVLERLVGCGRLGRRSFRRGSRGVRSTRRCSALDLALSGRRAVASPPSYCQVVGSYVPLSGRSRRRGRRGPRCRGSRSLTIVAAFVYADDVLAELTAVLEDVVDDPAEERDVASRRGSATCRSAIALVRVKRGSTWMTVAPRSFASITHWNPTGWPRPCSSP